MLKAQLRKEIRNEKRQFTSQQLSELSLAVIRRLLSHPKIIAAKIILMYYSLPDEVNTHQAVDMLLSEGKTILLPVVTSGEEMEIHYYEGANDLKVGPFNIMEPIGKIFTDLEDIDVAVVPGMSFDRQCNRLGRGKGYYDRFLSKVPDVYKIGVCFDFQKTGTIPTGNYDIKMNEIL